MIYIYTVYFWANDVTTLACRFHNIEGKATDPCFWGLKHLCRSYMASAKVTKVDLF